MKDSKGLFQFKRGEHARRAKRQQEIVERTARNQDAFIVESIAMDKIPVLPVYPMQIAFEVADYDVITNYRWPGHTACF